MQEQSNGNVQTNLKAKAVKNAKKEKSSFTKGFLEQLELVVIFFVIMVLIFTFMCKTCTVVGESMMETLKNGETVLIWNLFYSPDYGDIVVVHDNETLNEPIVKRVIGLPGDTVRVEHTLFSMKTTITHADGTVTILENEEYVRYIDAGGSFGHYSADETYIVNEGEIFVMGDNRLDSRDSRELGAYDSKQILGKVIFRIAPFNAMGVVN